MIHSAVADGTSSIMDNPPPTSIPFDLLRAPGSYVCNWNGFLLRVPPGSLGPGGREINIVGREPLFVTKISDDPNLPVTRARELASRLSLRVSF